MKNSFTFLHVLVMAIFAWQCLGPHAIAQWSSDPNINTPIRTAAHIADWPIMVSDGAGGCIVTWFEMGAAPPSTIYAQRINASGVALWRTNGVVICMQSVAGPLPLSVIPQEVLSSRGQPGVVAKSIRTHNASMQKAFYYGIQTAWRFVQQKSLLKGLPLSLLMVREVRSLCG